jgi:hypothetical protein
LRKAGKTRSRSSDDEMSDDHARQLFDQITEAHLPGRFGKAKLCAFCSRWIAARLPVDEVHGSSLPIAERIAKMPAATAAMEEALEMSRSTTRSRGPGRTIGAGIVAFRCDTQLFQRRFEKNVTMPQIGQNIAASTNR